MPMTSLFDAVSRDDLSVGDHSEPSFGYLNRSARPTAAAVRELIDSWYVRYPIAARSSLRSRFRLSDDSKHLSALFELYCYELLARLGHPAEVPAPDPGASTERLPDFFVPSLGTDGAWVEATLATDRNPATEGAEARLNHVYDALNTVDSPDFFLRAHPYGHPTRAVPATRLRREVQRFLASLDYDEMIALKNDADLDALPTLEFEHEGWRIDISIWPKSPAYRGQPDTRPLGSMGQAEASWVDDSVALRRAVEAKARHYGELSKPFVIAVNASNQLLSETDIFEALFGKQRIAIPVVNGRSGDLRVTRELNGAFTSRHGPRNRKVSAVLVCSSLNAWSVAGRTPVLIHNPFATLPLGSGLGALSHYLRDGSQMKFHEGLAGHDIFGLPEGWPLMLERDTA